MSVPFLLWFLGRRLPLLDDLAICEAIFLPEK
jgi:hypothetical protein